jgi:predicted transcriptional regulator
MFGIFLLISASVFQVLLADTIPCNVDYVKLEHYVQDLVDKKTASRDHEMEALKERVYKTERGIKVSSIVSKVKTTFIIKKIIYTFICLFKGV